MREDRVPPTRVAIIGTGMIASVHARAARDAGARLVGVLGTSSEKSRRAANSWGAERAYDDLDALLEDAPDVVHVCTPNLTHYDYALRIMRSGVNVVCEKPLADTVERARELLEVQREMGVVGTVPFVYRYHPLVREIAARRQRGDFGALHLIHGSYLQDWLVDPNSTDWRVDSAVGGASRAFADIGSHWSDLAEFISGERFSSVQATSSIVYPQRPSAAAGLSEQKRDVDTEDVAIATFLTENGIPANVVISQVSAGRKNRLWVEIDGVSGSAVFDQENPNVAWLGRERDSQLLHRGEATASAQQSRLNRTPAGHPEGYSDAFASFAHDTYRAINGEAVPGLPTFADGLRAVMVTNAVVEAAAVDSRIEIPTMTSARSTPVPM